MLTNFLTRTGEGDCEARSFTGINEVVNQRCHDEEELDEGEKDIGQKTNKGGTKNAFMRELEESLSMHMINSRSGLEWAYIWTLF